jgi:hypothetical protein
LLLFYDHSASFRTIILFCPTTRIPWSFVDGHSWFSNYPVGMALVRILVDGYSLLHNWLQLAPGKPRHSAAARDELIRRLTLYRDAIATPITVVFDGSGPRGGKTARTPTPEMEVLYSRAGQTADDIIERATVRFQPYGEVLVVTDDNVERETVSCHGGMTAGCLNFIDDVERVLEEQGRAIARHNRAERLRFKTSRPEKQPCR